MDHWAEIRRRVLTHEISRREACRIDNIHWATLKKILAHEDPPGYRRQQPARRPILEPVLPIIRQILDDDRQAPKKQRHSAHRIWQRLRDEHAFTGSYTVVKEAVREMKTGSQEVFLPLSHPPGEAQVDFGFAEVNLAGVPTQVALFVMSLPYADAVDCQVFPRECSEVFLEGHVRAFTFFGGVPRRIACDNTTAAVAKIVGSWEHLPTWTPGPGPGSGHLDLDTWTWTPGPGHPSRPADGTVDEVRIVLEDRLMARHVRCWGRGQSRFDPIRHLAMLERKPGGFNFAKPLENWELSDSLGLLRRRLEAEDVTGSETREFVRVLRLLEHHSLPQLTDAVASALTIDVIDPDSIRMILDHRADRPGPAFSLDGRPHLASVQVPATNVAAGA